MYKKKTFKNGLRLITVPDKKSQAVTVLVLVGTGSKYEKKEINGISHLLEHMLFKGTKKRPDKIDLIEPLDRVGGVYNAFTSEEYTGYFAKASKDNFELALDVISDIYQNSVLDNKELNREKRVIIEEINMYYDHPSSYVQNLWNQVLYGDQPAGWDIAGTKEGVLAISRKQLMDYMKSQYVSNNTVVCFAGNIPSESEINRKMNKYFKDIGKGDSISKKPVFENQKKPELIVLNKKTDQTHFCLGVRGYSLASEKRYTQEIIAAILGGMMTSRLFLKIREELGLAYYIKASSYSDTDTGCLVAFAGVDNSKAHKAILAILKEYKKMTDSVISLKELNKAKDNLKGRMALSLETSDSQASFCGLQEILQNEILKPSDIYDKINKISVRDVLSLSRDIFKSSKLNLALIGPFEDKEKFKKILKI